MNPENKDEKPVTKLTTGIWNIKLLDGTVIPFCYGTPDENPLETYKEFDLGMNWSIDTDLADMKDNEFEIGPDGSILIPKSMVKQVFFKPYNEINHSPLTINKTNFEDIAKKPKGIFCYNCGKAIPVGEQAIAVTTVTITENGVETYLNDPWITIACETCGSQINEVIGDLNTAFESLG